MNLTIHLPQFLYICNYFCYAGIVVETIQESEGENVCLPSVRVYVHLLYVLFLLIPVQLLQGNDLVLDPRYR